MVESVLRIHSRFREKVQDKEGRIFILSAHTESRRRTALIFCRSEATRKIETPAAIPERSERRRLRANREHSVEHIVVSVRKGR